MKKRKKTTMAMAPHISGSTSAVARFLLASFLRQQERYQACENLAIFSPLLFALAKLSATAYAYKGDMGPVICSLPVHTVGCTVRDCDWGGTARQRSSSLAQPAKAPRPAVRWSEYSEWTALT